MLTQNRIPFKKHFLLLCVGFGLISQINAQNYKRQKKDLVDLTIWQDNVWFVSPGLTYMLPFKPKGTNAPDVNPNGRLAIYAEVGRFKVFPGGGNVFNYMDYSLGYKRLSGSELFEGNKGIFKQNYAVANFNINNLIQLTDYVFIQNGLGLNADFRFLQNKTPSGSPIDDETTRFILSLHYRLGVGIKVTSKLFIIPTLETPILNGVEWENGRSDYGLFSSRYRPLIFSVRFAWLVKNKKGTCPPNPHGGKDGPNLDELLKME